MSLTRRGFNLLRSALGLALFLCLASSIENGRPLIAAIIVLLASPVAMIFAAWGLEPKGSVQRLLSLKTQSWMFLFGDSFGLTTAVAALAVAWQRMSDGWYSSSLWLGASLLIGIVAGELFHKMDGKAYTAKGAGELLRSPTKQVHDRLTYPVLAGALVYGGVPVLIQVWNSNLLLPLTFAIIGLSFWAVMGIRDNVVGLKPRELHPFTSKLR